VRNTANRKRRVERSALFFVIYDLVDDVKAGYAGLLRSNEIKEKLIGYEHQREVLKVTGIAAGCLSPRRCTPVRWCGAFAA
jgi:hypothetical protein